MKKVSLVYISLSGNTESFVTRLKDYLLSQYEGIEVQKIHIKDLVKEGQDFYEMDHPYVAFLPTYLEGGNGVDNGDVEILTCLLYTSPSPRDSTSSRMPSSA